MEAQKCVKKQIKAILSISIYTPSIGTNPTYCRSLSQSNDIICVINA